MMWKRGLRFCWPPDFWRPGFWRPSAWPVTRARPGGSTAPLRRATSAPRAWTTARSPSMSGFGRRADLPGRRPRPVRLSRDRACDHLCVGWHRGPWRGPEQSPFEEWRAHRLEERGFEDGRLVCRGGRSAGRLCPCLRAATAPRTLVISADTDDGGETALGRVSEPRFITFTDA